MPELLPCPRLHPHGLHIRPHLLILRLLAPKACDEQERLIDIELMQSIAEADGRAVLRRLGIYRDAAMFLVGAGWDVPLLRVACRLVTSEEGISQPFFKQQAMALHLACLNERR